jgi:uncharacterized OsmC-like protein
MKATKTLNGLDTEQMFGIIEAIKKQPEVAKFQFRASNEWLGGGVNRSTIQGFYGGGREDTSRAEPFVLTAGEPPVLLGANEGANAGEFLLHALAACVTTTFILHAAARGVRVRAVSTKLEGDVDLQGLLGLDESVTPGYEQIRIQMEVAADCSDEELDALLAVAQKHSPMVQTVTRPVPVRVERVAAGSLR